MGEFEKGIVKQALRERRPIPDKILDAPQLWLGLEFYWQAFLMLCSERKSDSAIPWSKMRLYCDEYFIFDLPDREDFCMIIRELDMKFLSLQSKKRELGRQNAKKSKESAPRRLRPKG